jgi:hypothetical protein
VRVLSVAHCDQIRCEKTSATVEGRQVCMCDCDECADAQREERERDNIRRAIDESRDHRAEPSRRAFSPWLAAIVIVCVFAAGGVGGYALRALGVGINGGIRVDCIPGRASLTWAAKNDSWSAAVVCWDVVIDCADKQRSSHACSSKLASGQYESRVVPAAEMPENVQITAMRVEHVEAK